MVSSSDTVPDRGSFLRKTLCILLFLTCFSGCMQNPAGAPADLTGSPSSTTSPTYETPDPAETSPGTEATSSAPLEIDGNDLTAPTSSAASIGVTVHSVLKTTQISNSNPLPGNVYVVVSLTIENPGGQGAYRIDRNTLAITDGGLLNEESQARLNNPLQWGRLEAGDSRSGEVVFGVAESTRPLTLTFLDDQGEAVHTENLGHVSQGSYVSDTANLALAEGDFSSVVEVLDTAKKMAHYAQNQFTFTFHTGCISYSPEEFFRLKEGDCKDFATFLSYVLDYHGYDAQLVTFSFYKEGERNGHVITLFTDTDGTMKYITTPDVTVFREVSSFDDLLKKECQRLGVPTIAEHRVLPAGSVDCCVG